MQIILLYILFLLILHLLLTTVSKRNHSKFEMLFCGAAYLGLIVLAAFRGPTVGADTLGYISDYNEINKYSFSEVFEIYSGYEFFYLVCKLFKLIDLPLAAWFAFIEVIYVSAIARLIHKDSTDKIYSIILFMTIGLYLFSLAGLKQTMAMGLVLHAFMELRNKKYIPAVLFAITAFFSHPSALVFIPCLILYFIRNIKRYVLVVASLSIALFIGSQYLFSDFFNIVRFKSFKNYLEIDESHSIWTFVFYLILIIPSLPFIKKYHHNQPYTNKARFEISCLLLACALQYLSSFSPSLFRLALYYTPFFVVFIPSVFDSKSDKSMRTIKILILLGVIFFFSYTNSNFVYSFA